MTSEEARAYAGDCRRAAAIAVHHANRSVEGINEIVRGAKESGRGIDLVGAVHDVLHIAVKTMLEPRGLLTLHAAIRSIATNEEHPMRLAAQYIVGRLDDDDPAVIAVLKAVKDGLGTHLILAVLQVYEECMPLLFSPPGIEGFQATAAQMLATENDPDE